MAIKAEGLKLRPPCCFKKISVDVCDIYDNMKTYQSRSRTEKRQWLASILATSSSLTSGLPHQHPLCRQCFCRYHGITKTFCYSILKKARAGEINFEHKGSHKKKPRTEVMTCHAWLKTYAKSFGDVMPDSGEVHLPTFSWMLVYKCCVQDLSSHSVPPVSYPRFLKMAKDMLPHVKVRKCKRFGKCTHCSKLDDLIAKSIGETREFWNKKKMEHNDWQMRERQKYYDHKDKSLAAATQHKALTICIDNMDQQKSNLPHMLRPDKELEKTLPLQVHVTGVMIYGMHRFTPMVFTWFDRFPSSSNILCTILLETLSKLSKTGEKFPPTLNLHLDNCWRENKNKYVKGFLKILVLQGYFKKIKVCYKPVGHTHDDPDQMFSCFSREFSRRNFKDIQELHHIMTESYNPHPECFHLDKIGAFNALLRRFLPASHEISGISKPRCFRIKRNLDGTVTYKYRNQLQTEKKKLPIPPVDELQPQLLDLPLVSDENGTYRKVARSSKYTSQIRLQNASPGVASLQADVDEIEAELQDDRWMPQDNDGFNLFKHGIPNLETVRVSPYKPIDIKALEKMVDCLSYHLTDAQIHWWDSLVKKFADEDAGYVFRFGLSLQICFL